MNLENVNTTQISGEPVRPEKLAGDYSTVAVATKLNQLKLDEKSVNVIDDKLNKAGFTFEEIRGTNFLDSISENVRAKISGCISTFSLAYKYDLDKTATVEEFAEDLSQVIKESKKEVILH